jgi:bifunctional UDP-N-acetylglucosamine pyrophosphorylase / glucosamine-1-phosphate N-acetyltransferase
VPSKTKPRSLAVVLLAAGKGRRLRSKLPKVLHPVCGRPSLWHVLNAARATRPDRVVVVVSHGAEEIESAVRSWGLVESPVFVDQGEPHGTGHAVAAAERAIGDVADVLVMAGDDPLVEGRHARDVLSLHRRSKAAATVLTSLVDDPTGYGRVVREGSSLLAIVEELDASPDVAGIREISTLVYAFRREDLFDALPVVGRDNRQGEYYLPDVLSILRDKGERVSAVLGDFDTWAGVNSRSSIATLSRVMRERINERHLAKGVTIVDPAQTFIDVDVRIGADTVIMPLTFLEGATRVGSRCELGPSVRILDSRIDDDAEVSFAVVRASRVGRGAIVGPFASLRPGTELGPLAKAGTFVEIKGSRVGAGSKVPHLSYVGDATIGKRTNVGAASVTVNYTGYEKHRTVIGDDVRIGSDTMLVAPVRVGDGAVTGAGSVITKDVPPGALAVERAEQRNVRGYRKRKDAEHGVARDADGGGAPSYGSRRRGRAETQSSRETGKKGKKGKGAAST